MKTHEIYLFQYRTRSVLYLTDLLGFIMKGIGAQTCHRPLEINYFPPS